MIPNIKISQTILEFGKSLILDLPEHHSQEEFETVITVIIAVWNCVVMDSWENGNKFEKLLLSSLEDAPKKEKVEIKRLIKRKKTKFSTDPRAVGDHWVREDDGGFIFGCDARLSVEHAPAENKIH